jgi:hypothetical protein
VSLPQHWKVLEDSETSNFVHTSTGDFFNIDITVTFKKHQQAWQQPAVKCNGKEVNFETTVRTKDDLEKFIKKLDKMQICPGTGLENKKRDKDCEQLLFIAIKSNSTRCKLCNKEKRRLQRHKSKQEKSKIKRQKKLTLNRKKIYRMKTKVL